jgi:outer membrane murein-binding lipoprotein Lpp
MSRGVSTIAIAGAVIVAVAAGAWLLGSRSDDEATMQTDVRNRNAKRQARNQVAAAVDGSLEDRVAELEKEVEQMRQEMKKLRMVRGSAVARGATVGDDAAEPSEAPAFEGAVRDIIETEREEAREKRTDAMRDRFSQRHGEIMDELVAVAGLNKSERESIEGMWETEMNELIPLFIAAREGERPFGEVREEAEKIRNATDVSVEEMLTPEQFEQYKELRPGPPQRRRGGERRGPPPG